MTGVKLVPTSKVKRPANLIKKEMDESSDASNIYSDEEVVSESEYPYSDEEVKQAKVMGICFLCWKCR